MRTRDVVDPPDAMREISETGNAAGRSRARTLDDPGSRCEASAESRQRVDGDWEPRPFEAPRDELARFDLKRAGMPNMTIQSAAEYVSENRASRPWVAMTDHASPEARRIIASMDLAGVHPHIRHEGWVTEEANRRRVAYREDPAQLDPDKREQSIDGLRENNRRHRCADTATRITDPDAFATAYSRGVEHPKVQTAMDMAFSSKDKPDAVSLPIADLLGPDGHRYCTGWRLEPVDGSMKAAYDHRNGWVVDRAEGRKPDRSEPQARPIPTFEGGTITFIFKANETERRYEVATMCPDPPGDLQRGS